MNEKPPKQGNNKLFAQVEALKNLVQSLVELAQTLPEDQQNYLLETVSHIDNIDTAELRELCEQSLKQDFTGFAALREEIELKGQKIQEFKLSLADSVMEHKSAQRLLQSANEKNNALTVQLSQMQLHSKELDLNLTATSKKLQIKEEESESLQKEVSELRNKAYAMKSQNAELQDYLKNAETKLDSLQSDHNKALSQLQEAKEHLNRLASDNSSLQQSRELLELRERELEEAVDALQREKNHLQEKLNGMLTGIKKNFVYRQAVPGIEESSVLEPSFLHACLPFCFPERLPTPLKLRKEIKSSFPSAYTRRERNFPEIFAEYRRIKLRSALPRTAFKATAKLKATTELMLLPETAINIMPQKAANPVYQTGVSTSFACTHAEPQTDLPVRLSLRQKQTRVCNSRLDFDTIQTFSIITASFDLYLSYLSETLIKKHFSINTEPLSHFSKFSKANVTLEKFKLQNNLTETLAFKARFQLKSQKLSKPRINMAHSFKRENKLKSVLKTFGNTITSMVQKYDIVQTTPTDDGGNVI